MPQRIHGGILTVKEQSSALRQHDLIWLITTQIRIVNVEIDTPQQIAMNRDLLFGTLER